MPSYAIIRGGPSRSFPEGDAFSGSASDPGDADVLIYLAAAPMPDSSRAAVLVELGTESLAVYTGEDPDESRDNVVGFARYRNGDDPPSQLIELVTRPWTRESALAAARNVFEAAGLAVVVCADQPGRIIDRLVRPKYNAALRLLDEGLATQADMDLTCRLGLGYPDGPIERVKRGGLAHHHAVTQALFETYGTSAYAPPRQAVVAARRKGTGNMRPLEGLLVLDFSTLLPGPMATLLLAEAGAEVVKIERPAGEEMRHYEPRWGRDSVNFALLNRGKKSLALDLKDPAQRAKLDPLIARADILVEQFRPGVMARLGLDYETLAKLNPRLIYCAITGYGQNGPKRDVAGHDLNYLGDAGLLSLSMGPADRPVVPPALIADIAGGAYPAVMNILLALQQRARTGRGTYLDVAMSDNLFPFMYWAIGNGLVAGTWPGNGSDLVTGGSPRYQLYPTADGRMVAAAPLEQKFWETFCEIIGLEPELRDDSNNPAATKARVAELIAEDTGPVWAERFAGRDCCCSVVATVGEALEDPHFKSRGLFDHVLGGEGGGTLPALPVPIAPAFRGAPGEPVAAPPLGANNEDDL